MSDKPSPTDQPETIEAIRAELHVMVDAFPTVVVAHIRNIFLMTFEYFKTPLPGRIPADPAPPPQP
jgi:hypothetical protein